MNKVESVGKKSISVVSGIIGSNKRWIELFLVGIITLEYIPHEVLGFKLKKMLAPVNDSLRSLFQNQFLHLALFITMVWSCCIKRDLVLFLLLSIFMMTYRINHELDDPRR